jgi:hypothetical protein
MPEENIGVIPLSEHFTALFEEQQRAFAAADKALRDHIDAQIARFREALDAAGLLEAHRIEGVKREMTLITEAAQIALDKLAEAYEKRFEQQNEWRARLADRERVQQEEMAKLTNSFMLREVGDSKFEDVRREMTRLAEKVNKLV